MNQRIRDLKSTTFGGRTLARKQTAEVQETVALLPNRSRKESCKTICEHLNWTTATGDYRVGACQKMLEHRRRREALVDRHHTLGYRAPNWQRIGQTVPRQCRAERDIDGKPLCPNSREILRGEIDTLVQKKPPTRAERGRSGGRDRSLLPAVRNPGGGLRRGRARRCEVAVALPRVQQPADHAVRVPSDRRPHPAE